MTAATLISSLEEGGASLWCEGERLRFRAPKGTWTAEQRAELVARRTEVVAYLRAQAAGRVETYPLSYSQQALWFMHQQAPQSAMYNVALSFRIRGPVDLAALRHALQALSDRHATLRTTYNMTDEGLVQFVPGAASVELDLVTVDPRTDDAAMKSLVTGALRRPFDLARGPVFRPALFTRAAEDHVLLLTMHHIATDGWSLLTLFQEFTALYGEARGGPLVKSTRGQKDYSDYVRWQERMLSGEEGERLWNYWRQKLAAPLQQLQLSGDRLRPVVQRFEGSSIPVRLGGAATAGVKRLAREMNTTPFIVLFSAFQTFLSGLTGAADIVTGTPVFGRSQTDFVQIVGDFVNSLPIRARVAEGMRFRDLIDQMRATVVEALDAQEMPLPLLVRRLQPKRSSAERPLFNTFFILQRFDDFKDLEQLLGGDESRPPVDLNGLRVTPYPLEQQSGQFDLSMELGEVEGAYGGALKYSTEIFDPATVEGYVQAFVAQVEALVADPDQLLTTLRRGATTDEARRLLEQLAQRGVKVSLDGERLRVSAPKAALDDPMRAKLVAHREDLISTLRRLRSERRQSSALQQQLRAFDDRRSGLSGRSVGAAIDLRGGLDQARLLEAVRTLVASQDALRTCVGESDGGLMLEVAERAAATIETIDLAELPAAEREAATRRTARALLERETDVTQGPLASFGIIRPDEDHHVLVISLHPLIGDALSLAIAFRRLMALYSEEPFTAPAPLHAPLEASGAHGAAPAPTPDTWAALGMPTDRPPPAVPSGRVGHYCDRIDDVLMDRLKRLSAQQGEDLQAVLITAWQVLLHVYAGQDEIVIGVPLNDGASSRAETIGRFAQDVAIRGMLAGNPRFCDLLRQVRQAIRGAAARAVAVNAPLQQPFARFALRSGPIAPPAPAGLQCALLDIQSRASGASLSVEISAARDAPGGAAYEFDEDLFDSSTIATLHARFVRLLQSIVAEPSQRLDALPLLTDADDHLLARQRDTAVEHDRSRLLHHLIEAAAERHPDALAVTAGDASLTYAEFDARANRLARLIQTRGVGRGNLVAVCLPRQADMPVVLAAVLKAGAAYVPLDPAHPRERLQHVLDDAGARLVVTTSQLADLFDAGAPVLQLDEDASDLAAQAATRPDVAGDPTDLAYVIYTSGSTGRPKGVQVEHRNVVSFLEAMRREPGLTADDTVLALTTLSFDIAGLELWLPLSTGARVVVAPRETAVSGPALIELLEREHVSLMQATPSTWRLLIEAGWTGKSDLRALCGGEALPADLAGALLPRVGALWNMYGPTETTIWSTAARIADMSSPPSIGWPIANTQTHLLCAAGRLVPPGVIGELCIAGEGVSRGYLNRPELTAEKFVALNIPGVGEERLYRTGDMAKLGVDGRLLFLGRRDDQVKLRGYRIELGEIETALARSPAVRACVASVREDAPGAARLVAHVVATPGASFDVNQARAALRESLPDYMIPSAFVIVDALPLTPNGKIDRKALPAPAASNGETEADGLLMNPTERRIMQIWGDLLGVGRIGLRDNFFDLGGHSLLMARLHVRLQQTFNPDLSLVELFQKPTVAGQAELLSGRQGGREVLRRARSRAERQAHA